MSGMPPVQPRSREMEIVRVLFDRHLLDRAVNLAEARWAGSGDMVRLAYSWPELEPGERRQSLEELGPERISKFRAFADLHPELAQTIDNLEARGGLSVAPDPVVVVVRESEPPQPAQEPDPPLPDSPEEALTGSPADDAVTTSEASPVESFDGPTDLRDFDLPDTASVAGAFEEFQTRAKDRREESLATGAETLERIRARLDTSARRVGAGPIGSGPSSLQLSARLPATVTATTGAAQTQIVVDEGRFTPPPGYWLERLAGEQVVVADGRVLPPSDDELVALANELGLGFAEFDVEIGSARQVFGGLVRHGRTLEVEVGSLPTALAAPALVVVRGRLFTKQVERLSAGFCDIPGTHATVRLDPASRVLVIPN